MFIQSLIMNFSAIFSVTSDFNLHELFFHLCKFYSIKYVFFEFTFILHVAMFGILTLIL